MTKNNIRGYQQQIIDIIMKKLQQDVKEIFIEMPAGTGKNTVIKYLIQLLDSKNQILIMNNTKVLEQQFKEDLRDYENIIIGNYYTNILPKVSFDYIILNDIENISEEKYKSIYQTCKKAKIICFCDRAQRIKESGKWLEKKTMDYSLTMQKVINEGYINPNYVGSKFECFIEKLIKELKFTNIEKEVAIKTDQRVMRADFVVDNNERKIMIEVKDYKSEFIQNTIIKQAVEQVEYYKKIWKEKNEKEVEAVLIMSCQVPDEIKEISYKERKILIIDISNLLYLSQENDELMKALIEGIHYNIYNIMPKPLIDLDIFKIQPKENLSEAVEAEISTATDFIQKLEKLGYGKENENDKKYEKLCVDIIKFLFGTEFTRMSEQSSTEDRMFRMDLICGLKETSEFWKILIHHYNTRFVVFEFKNYEDKIDQNLIYITEKYLYNAVLRNVAIIISRRGFSYNAHKAATGILTESGKLIIELEDNDIITMLRMKADGQDASDYLLNILEQYLISISK